MLGLKLNHVSKRGHRCSAVVGARTTCWSYYPVVMLPARTVQVVYTRINQINSFVLTERHIVLVTISWNAILLGLKRLPSFNTNFYWVNTCLFCSLKILNWVRTGARQCPSFILVVTLQRNNMFMSNIWMCYFAWCSIIILVYWW